MGARELSSCKVISSPTTPFGCWSLTPCAAHKMHLQHAGDLCKHFRTVEYLHDAHALPIGPLQDVRKGSLAGGNRPCSGLTRSPRHVQQKLLLGTPSLRLILIHLILQRCLDGCSLYHQTCPSSFYLVKCYTLDGAVYAWTARWRYPVGDKLPVRKQEGVPEAWSPDSCCPTGAEQKRARILSACVVDSQ